MKFQRPSLPRRNLLQHQTTLSLKNKTDHLDGRGYSQVLLVQAQAVARSQLCARAAAHEHFRVPRSQTAAFRDRTDDRLTWAARSLAVSPTQQPVLFPILPLESGGAEGLTQRIQTHSVAQIGGLLAQNQRAPWPQGRA